MNRPPCILYLNTAPGDRIQGMTLAGIRRYAAARGWMVEAVPSDESRPGDVPPLLAAHHPVVGCVVDCSDDSVSLPPRLFGTVPVVYLHPPPSLRRNRATYVATDNEAVARAAFRELSAARPPVFAVAGVIEGLSWSRERERTFIALAAKAAIECRVFGTRSETKEKVPLGGPSRPDTGRATPSTHTSASHTSTSSATRFRPKRKLRACLTAPS